MPCSAISEDYIRREGHIKVDPSTIYYRPAYSIANWEMICNSWAGRFKRLDGPYNINFRNLQDIKTWPWEYLGHKDLDSAKPLSLSETDQQVYDQLDATITFKGGRPAVVDVNRGLWDVKALRSTMTPLSKTAPAVVAKPFCKTTKLLLSFGFEIKFKLPQSIGLTQAKDINLAPLRLPASRVSEDGTVLTFSAGGNTYPVLLAVLANVV